jgi:SHS2 domain-containing protein
MSHYYQELAHTADWRIRVWGATLPELFAHAAAAMAELQGAPMAVTPTLARDLSCQAIDLETLLVAWLNELLYWSEVEDALYTRFAVHLIATGDEEPFLQAHVAGLPGRGPLAHIKAVTFHELSLEKTPTGWEARITFDT